MLLLLLWNGAPSLPRSGEQLCRMHAARREARAFKEIGLTSGRRDYK